jgi:hypothetical protein
VIEKSSSHATAQKASIEVSRLKDFVSTLLPSISVAALVLVSIFNIGYFSNIGLHFLGLIDLTNIVYSVGLVFGGLVVAINLLATMLEVILKLAKDEAATTAVSRWLLVALAALATMATIWLSMQPSGASDASETYAAVLLSLVLVWAAAKVLLRFKTRNEVRFSEILIGGGGSLERRFRHRPRRCGKANASTKSAVYFFH